MIQETTRLILQKSCQLQAQQFFSKSESINNLNVYFYFNNFIGINNKMYIITTTFHDREKCYMVHVDTVLVFQEIYKLISMAKPTNVTKVTIRYYVVDG